MQYLISNIKTPAFISFLLVSPFMLLEWLNRRNFHEGYPFPLFAILWILGIAFFSVLMPIVRDVRAGEKISERPIPFFLSAAFLVLVAWLWGSILLDQMSCFLGIPNCD